MYTKKFVSIFLLLFLILFINLSSYSVRAENNASNYKQNQFVIVSTFEELQTSLKNEKNIKFGSDIIIPKEEFLNLSPHKEYQNYIDTGEFTLFVEGDLIFGTNSVISGAGTKSAVVSLVNGGRASSIYNDEYLPSELHVYSDGGIGIFVDEQSSYKDPSNTNFLKIYAKNGTGIYSESELFVCRNFIEAEYGIIAEKPVNIFLSYIKSEKKAIQAPFVTADTSNLYPYLDEYGTIPYRNISSFTSAKSIVPINTNFDDYFEKRQFLSYNLSADGLDDFQSYSYLNLITYENDTTKENIYYADIEREEWMDLCGLKTDTPYPIYVRDLNIPAFYSYFTFFTMGTITYKYYGDVETLTLWCSEDEGKTWFIPEDADFFSNPSEECIDLFIEKTNIVQWFMWEVEGIGKSEILKINWNDLDIITDIGGDRNGGDREEQKPLPKPSPEPEVSPPLVGKPQNTPPPQTEKPNPEKTSPPQTEKPKPEKTAPPQTEKPKPEKTAPPQTEKPKPEKTAPPQTEKPKPEKTAPPQTEKPKSEKTSPPQTKSPEIQAGAGTNNDALNSSSPQNNSNDNFELDKEYTNNQGLGVSGKRISAMLNNKNTAFFNGNMRIVFSSEYLKSLNLNNNDIFEIVLYQPNDSSFNVYFSINGETPKNLPDEFQVTLNCKSDVLLCSLDNTNFINAVVNKFEQTAEFTLYSMGSYTTSSDILEEDKKEKDNKETFIEIEEETSIKGVEQHKPSTLFIIIVSFALVFLLVAIIFYKLKATESRGKNENNKK